jgi:hypothetical protein
VIVHLLLKCKWFKTIIHKREVFDVGKGSGEVGDGKKVTKENFANY